MSAPPPPLPPTHPRSGDERSPVIAAIRTALFAKADSTYRAFQCPLMPTVDPARVIGVRTPDLRRLAKETAGDREATADFLSDLPHAYFEENQLHAFLIERIPDFAAALAETEAFLPFIDNWATCDQLSPRAFRGRPEELLPHARRWLASPHTYTARFGIGMLMRYGLDDPFDPTCLAMVADPALTVREDYYLRMMIAWYFATALAKQYDATLPYVEARRLPQWIHNKTIQKAIESYRIPLAHKSHLRTLRISTH